MYQIFESMLYPPGKQPSDEQEHNKQTLTDSLKNSTAIATVSGHS